MNKEKIRAEADDEVEEEERVMGATAICSLLALGPAMLALEISTN